MHTFLEKYFEIFWKLIQAISKIIGQESTIRISSLLGRYASNIFKRERQISLAQLSLPKAKALIKGDTNKIIANNFSHIGECVGELLCIDKVFDHVDSGKAKGSIPCISYSNFDEKKDLIKNGGMALSGHLGCIEYLAAYHVQRGIPLHVVARSPNYKSAAKVLDQLRRRYGIIVAWRDDPKSLRVLSNAIKSGNLIAALIDQDTALESKYSNFFGVDAAYPIAPIKLALRYKIPIFSAFIYRLRRLKHHIAAEQIKYDLNDSNLEQNILNIFNSRLENMVAHYPEQWIWWHRRWRRQQDNSKVPSTNEYIEWLTQIK